MNPLRITLLACLVPAVAPPEGADEARAILDRAIEAHGGEDRIARTTVGHVVARGKFALPDFPECDVTWEETFDLPGRYRRVIQGKGAGRAFRMEYALTDRSGWLR